MARMSSQAVRAPVEEFVCKVNLGCGVSGSEGWYNFDNSPTILLSRIPVLCRWKRIPRWPSDVRRVDVIKGLPCKSGTVDCIYSSHMVEHLAFSDAVKVLSHCHQALRFGGILRIAVPDLRAIVDDYLADGSAPIFIDRLHLRSNVSEVFHRGAHHQTMYDASYLAFLFRQSGFSHPERKEFGHSEIPDIGSVELESRKHESLYMEATK
jgi:predicted SAM-dependent methyltransferase